MGYFDGLYQGRFESQAAIKRANKTANDWQAYARQLEADLKEAQLAALANKHVLEDAVDLIKQVAPRSQLADESKVKALKYQYFEQEKQNRGW